MLMRWLDHRRRLPETALGQNRGLHLRYVVADGSLETWEGESSLGRDPQPEAAPLSNSKSRGIYTQHYVLGELDPFFAKAELRELEKFGCEYELLPVPRQP